MRSNHAVLICFTSFYKQHFHLRNNSFVFDEDGRARCHYSHGENKAFYDSSAVLQKQPCSSKKDSTQKVSMVLKPAALVIPLQSAKIYERRALFTWERSRTEYCSEAHSSACINLFIIHTSKSKKQQEKQPMMSSSGPESYIQTILTLPLPAQHPQNQV